MDVRVRVRVRVVVRTAGAISFSEMRVAYEASKPVADGGTGWDVFIGSDCVAAPDALSVDGQRDGGVPGWQTSRLDEL